MFVLEFIGEVLCVYFLRASDLDNFGEMPESFYRISASVGGYFVMSPPPLRANPLHDITWRWYFHDAVVSSTPFTPSPFPFTRPDRLRADIVISPHFQLQVFPNRTHFISTKGALVVLDAGEEKAGPYKVEATSSLGRVQSRDYVVEMNSGES